jgi:hypothetical protein
MQCAERPKPLATFADISESNWASLERAESHIDDVFLTVWSDDGVGEEYEVAIEKKRFRGADAPGPFVIMLVKKAEH